MAKSKPMDLSKYRARLSDECLDRSGAIIKEDGSKIILDEHQEEGMLASAIALSDGEKQFSIVHPGGSGKTVLEAGIIQASQAAKDSFKSGKIKDTKDIVLTVERTLMSSVRDHIQSVLGKKVGLWGMGHRELDADVLIVNIQALQVNRKKLRKLLDPDKVSLILGDEADKFLTPQRKEIIEKFRNAVRIGFTATPEWPDERHINEIWGEIVHKLSLTEGIKKGINANPLYYLYNADLDGDEIKVANGDYDQISLAAAMKSVEIEMAIPEIYGSLDENERKNFPTLVYVPSVHTLHATTERLRQVYPDLNITSWHGSVTSSTLSREIHDFRDGKVDILVLCEMGGRGLDLPRARCIIDAYPTLSKTKLEQRHSRALRKIRPGTPEHESGFKKPFALIHHVQPKSNSFRPVTLFDIIKGLKPGQLLPRGGKGGGGTGSEGHPPIEEEVKRIADQIRSSNIRANVSLLDQADIRKMLDEIKLREDLPMADDDGFIYLPDNS
jgi:superfamily II DNA or RNA helicase